MAALANAADVAAGWRSLSIEEIAVAETLCARASAMIRTSVAGVDARVTTDSDYATVVTGVVADMVKRVLVNPDCRREGGIDDARWTLDQAVSTGALYVSAEEYAALRREPGNPTTPAYVVSLGG